MSSLSEYSGFSGQQPAKLPEKSTFSHTCSLLSQYLKEKGSFGDLNLGMTCNNNTEPIGSPETSCQSATTMNLFPTAMDILSPKGAHRPHHCAEEIPTLVTSSAFNSVGKEAKAAQLTIFYDGQVIVFDDFPADKAKEIMSFASKGISQTQNNSRYAYTQNQPSFPPTLIRPSAEHPQPPSTPVVCDLPIARKASLHRFLEKRKDRIAAKAPYPISYPMADPKKQVESVPWLGLGAYSSRV